MKYKGATITRPEHAENPPMLLRVRVEFEPEDLDRLNAIREGLIDSDLGYVFSEGELRKSVEDNHVGLFWFRPGELLSNPSAEAVQARGEVLFVQIQTMAASPA